MPEVPLRIEDHAAGVRHRPPSGRHAVLQVEVAEARLDDAVEGVLPFQEVEQRMLPGLLVHLQEHGPAIRAEACRREGTSVAGEVARDREGSPDGVQADPRLYEGVDEPQLEEIAEAELDLPPETWQLRLPER